MSERLPKTAEQARLESLLSSAGRFLGDSTPLPGEAYDPIRLPLSWLFKRDGEHRITGYRASRRYLGQSGKYRRTPSDRRAIESPIEKQIAKLENYGLIRQRSNRIYSGGAYSEVYLYEYQDARLVGRKVLPIDEERLYSLAVAQIGSDGRGPEQVYEHFIFSSGEGLLQHTPESDSIAGAMDRASLYLEGEHPDLALAL